MPAQSPTLSPTLSAITAGVARIVLGDAGFDLADQVGADIGALGEDAAAESGEDRDQRTAESEANQRLAALCRPASFRSGSVVAGDAQQAEAHHQQCR